MRIKKANSLYGVGLGTAAALGGATGLILGHLAREDEATDAATVRRNMRQEARNAEAIERYRNAYDGGAPLALPSEKNDFVNSTNVSARQRPFHINQQNRRQQFGSELRNIKEASVMGNLLGLSLAAGGAGYLMRNHGDQIGSAIARVPSRVGRGIRTGIDQIKTDNQITNATIPDSFAVEEAAMKVEQNKDKARKMRNNQKLTDTLAANGLLTKENLPYILDHMK